MSLLETPITTPTIFILVFLLSDPFLCQRSEKLNACIQRSKLKKCIIEVNRSSILYYAVTIDFLSSNRNSCFYMFWVSFILFFFWWLNPSDTFLSFSKFVKDDSYLCQVNEFRRTMYSMLVVCIAKKLYSYSCPLFSKKVLHFGLSFSYIGQVHYGSEVHCHTCNARLLWIKSCLFKKLNYTDSTM